MMTFLFTLVCLFSTVSALISCSQLYWTSDPSPNKATNFQSSKYPLPFFNPNDPSSLFHSIKCEDMHMRNISMTEMNEFLGPEILEAMPGWLKTQWLSMFENSSNPFSDIFINGNKKITSFNNDLRKKPRSITYKEITEINENLIYSEIDLGKVSIEHKNEKTIEFENTSNEPVFVELFIAPANIHLNYKHCKNEFYYNEEDEFEHLPKSSECEKDTEIEIIKTLTNRKSPKLKRTLESVNLYGKLLSGLGLGNNDFDEILFSSNSYENKSMDFPFYLEKRKIFIIPPHSIGNIGALVFQPNHAKKYSASLFIRNGSKLVQHIKIVAEGISYSLSILDSKSGLLNFHISESDRLDNELVFRKDFTLLNSGQVQASIKGIYLDGASCEMHGFILYPCGESIKIDPGFSYKISLLYAPDFHEFSANYHMEIYTDIEIIEIGINLNFPVHIIEKSAYANFKLYTLRGIEIVILFIFSITLALSLTLGRNVCKTKNSFKFTMVSSKFEIKESFIWIPQTYEPPYFLQKQEAEKQIEQEISQEICSEPQQVKLEKNNKTKKSKKKPRKFAIEINDKPSKPLVQENQIFANNSFLSKKRVKTELRCSIASDENTAASYTTGTNLNNSIAENEDSPMVTWHTEDDFSELALDEEDYFIDTYRAGNGLFSGPTVLRSFMFENDPQVSFD
ncbi:unnamed protein product [Blepharisma stoltei]|uniref:TMEM131L fifth Ig-like domain-containing protein n=1 Tax=Blepharisma stoltei TaxID=1481888 RepID=A0AAU9INC4_9CILI|nr:unnamed protein product [Blepharisma stoltei]